jgi:TonB-linked SusC/RagA family outer membrane protein
MFCCITGVTAQNTKLISGTVTDEKGSPLQGATVTVKGAKKLNTVTDANGNYVINAPAGATALIVSYVGMKAVEVPIGTNTQVNFSLKGADSKLSEVVVVGYGTKKRAEVTTSVASVSEKEIKNLPMAGVDQLIQGKVAGATIMSNGGQPGGGVSVRIRGITSVNGNDPLYVIDGVPIGDGTSTSISQEVLGGGSGQRGQSVLATLNPADIASVDILKDASAQAIYGSRAANGVVIINTKRGKAGEGKISYDTYFGWQKVTRMMPIMNLREFSQYQNGLVKEIRDAGSWADSIPEFKNSAILGPGTNWQDELFRTGTMQNHQLAFSGGSDKTTYYFSGNYFNQQGIIINSGFKRYALRMNIDHQVKKWFKAGISANMSNTDQRITLSNGFDAITSVVLWNSPATPIRDVNGNFITSININGQQVGNPNNPIAQAYYRDVRSAKTRVVGAVYQELGPIKGLTFRNEVNYDFSLSKDKAFQPFIRNDSANVDVISPSKLSEQRTNSLFIALKDYISFARGFGSHWIDATVGHEINYSEWDYLQAYRKELQQNLPSLAVGNNAPDGGQEIGAGNGKWSMESYFARLGYTYNNKYSVSASIRRDGSSSFGPDKRWGTFWAASAAWTVTNENFFKDIPTINYLKLRVGYGSVGNQNTGGANLYTTNIDLTRSSPFGPGGFPRNLGNPTLGWEAVKTYNAGFDATLFNRFMDVTVDVYRKKTTRMLLSTQLPDFSGLSTSSWLNILTPTANDGEMTNTGIDIAVTTYNIRGNEFNWKTGIVFSHYKNVLNRLNTADAALYGRLKVDYSGNDPVVTVTKPGQAVGTFYGYVTDGLFRSMDELNSGTNWGIPVSPQGYWLGDIRYKDLNNNKVIDNEDVTYIGNPNPKFTGSITNTFTWKGLDLNIMLYGSYGAKILNMTRRLTEGMSNPWNNQLNTVLNRYTPDNTGGALPRFNMWHNNNFRISDRFIEDGSFLRIQTIAIGYNLPKQVIAKAKLSNARLYVSGQNLHTFTKYTGYNPEVGSIDNDVRRMNIDNGNYPLPRTITIGANIEF